jgi:hypothetical protein
VLGVAGLALSAGVAGVSAAGGVAVLSVGAAGAGVVSAGATAGVSVVGVAASSAFLHAVTNKPAAKMANKVVFNTFIFFSNACVV